MRKFRKQLAAALALTLAASMTAVPAYAVDIIMQGSSSAASGALRVKAAKAGDTAKKLLRTYNAYKLLDLKTSEDGTKFSYTLPDNSKYKAVLQEQVFADASEGFWTKQGGKPTKATDVTAEQIIAFLGALTSDGEEASGEKTEGSLRDFADALYRRIKEAKPEISYDATASDTEGKDAEFSGLQDGYWMIADVTDISEGSEEANSLVIIPTAKEDTITVKPKVDVPKVEKKVEEKNDSATPSEADKEKWQDVADYDMGDDVPFKLTGTLPSYLASYDKYTYVFHDNLSDGLTFNNDVAVTIDGKEIPKDKYTVVTDGLTDVCDFEVRFDDLLKLGVEGLTVTKDSKVVVTYTAKLGGKDVVIGDKGNPNEVSLEFSNKPYEEGTGKTKPDKVTVFTFKLDVNKIDMDKHPVKGAGFTLYKFIQNTGKYEPVGEEVKGQDLTKFTWKGLDSGIYRLVETTVPDGYNKAADIDFKVVATYTTVGEDQQMETLVVQDANGNEISGDGDNFVFHTTAANGTITTAVVNTTGMELPSTGGMGTTLFYVVGGILAAGAGVLLITKKRMNKMDEQ